jgi:hypothetical protein
MLKNNLRRLNDNDSENSSYDCISLICDKDEDNCLNISNESFVLDVEGEDKRDTEIYMQFKDLKESIEGLPSMRFNILKIYNLCLNSKCI